MCLTALNSFCCIFRNNKLNENILSYKTVFLFKIGDSDFKIFVAAHKKYVFNSKYL